AGGVVASAAFGSNGRTWKSLQEAPLLQSPTRPSRQRARRTLPPSLTLPARTHQPHQLVPPETDLDLRWVLLEHLAVARILRDERHRDGNVAYPHADVLLGVGVQVDGNRPTRLGDHRAAEPAHVASLEEASFDLRGEDVLELVHAHHGEE